MMVERGLNPIKSMMGRIPLTPSSWGLMVDIKPESITPTGPPIESVGLTDLIAWSARERAGHAGGAWWVVGGGWVVGGEWVGGWLVVGGGGG